MVFQASDSQNGNVTAINFEKCLDNVTKHVFPEKSGKIQKQYMRQNNFLKKFQPVKEWVGRVLKLDKYLLSFPKNNGNPTQKLIDAELMDILEYEVPYNWRRDFILHAFDPVEEGMKKII